MKAGYSLTVRLEGAWHPPVKSFILTVIMKALRRLQRKKPQIEAIARRHGVRILRVFGSVARGEETRRSDIDFLVQYKRVPTFAEIYDAQDELTKLLGRRVQFIARDELSPYIRDHALREAVPL